MLDSIPIWINDGQHDMDIAKFVIEGDEFVEQIVSRAVNELRRTTRGKHLTFAAAVTEGTSESLEAVVEALYLHLKNDYHLLYEFERAFYEVTGEQQIRLPVMTGEANRGTCIDLVILFLSCLSNVKLWPVYLQIRTVSGFDHALAATWLEEPSPDRGPLLDIDCVRKALSDRRLLVLDCTGFVEGYPGRQYKLSFEESKKEALQFVEEGEVRFALDVRRAWESGVWERGLDKVSRTNNLPYQLTSFIGREREIAEVKRMLSSNRLLTLTGAGGCGKTRLALQVGTELLKEYADGVWLVELAALVDSRLVAQEVASALGVREEPNRPLLATLSDYLKPRHLLLVLDNCEHLDHACADLADALLRACPNLRILATSRYVLGIPGEVAWRVPSLSLPDLERLPPIGADLVSAVMPYDAARLFIERAVKASKTSPTFSLTSQNASVVAQICNRLDGIPLAIELAAAWVDLLKVEEILERLKDRFRLLTRGSKTALPRQKTLQATVDWSYDLLNPPERVLFNRLSVFAGGFTLEAVCAGEGVEEYEVLDLLSRLVDKSLVVTENVGDSIRFSLLETLREYGGEKLRESGKAEKVWDCHLDFFLSLSEKAELELTGSQQAAWLKRLEVDHDNLRVALRWSVESGKAEHGLRLGGALWRFWSVRGYLKEGRDWLTGFLGLPAATAHTATRAKALNGAGMLAYNQGDYTSARSLHEESLAISRELGDKEGIAGSLNNLGILANYRGDYVVAYSLHEKSLAIFRELGDKEGIARSLNNLGIVTENQGDYSSAHSFYEKSLAIFRELGDKEGIANSLNNLGILAENQGDYITASSLYEESLAISRELGDKRCIARSLNNLGTQAKYRGDYTTARFLFEESLLIFRELGNKEGIANCLEGLAGVAGKPERAARLFGAAEILREAIRAPLPPADRADYDRNLATYRAGLNEKAFAAAWAQGRAMALEQSIAYALEREEVI